MANSVDPDQTVPEVATWSGSAATRSGSALFAYAILSENLVHEILGHLLYSTFQEVKSIWSVITILLR